MTGFAIFLGIILILLTPLILIGALLVLLRRKFRATQHEDRAKRIAIVLAGIAVIASPYLTFKAYELHFVLARVPSPLHVAWIEYRLEDSFGGIGMPGDNETGFVVYRLTEGTAEWARSKGSRLGEALPGGRTSWHATPVDETGSRNRWHHYDSEAERHRHPVTIREYLDTYGFSIPVETGRDDEANRAIREAGSFYSYGRGGSVTIVDPARGKVYFAYAG
ncbi:MULTISPECIES: hypothetical protein [Sphingobium]|jgi:hypothetical protein|uniref:Uncharacterized protein n=1 Tax=Sphingobium limneticum TaxID=1007511 RepID=A0A5J5I8T6_9SPHN|nr:MULTISPECIES: hypothetical protein [Sphingobium]KAA9020140.1 hypothetical protein F4U94_00680 [Sphingobium limneticum]KAA9021380.1 hypothetical protein F4U96_01415 [Sphingobium limneticum]KAA9033742.1 hypothetical protein F4U95_01415 [Sphingobium limneticum]